MLKQNLLPLLIEYSNKVDQKAQTLIYEILWSASFSPDIALFLRSNPQFLDKIQTITKTIEDEALKKATEGLCWKLIQGIKMK
jgi:hypothetical protein